MKFKDEAAWDKGLENNKDGYGRGIFAFAERWANLMEREIEKNVPITVCAEPMSKKADTDGITGFMYGAAVSVLSQCWIHGEELRRWHNKEISPSQAGSVNITPGAVLNPALLRIG